MFERVFDSSQDRGRRQARLASLPVAVVIHGLAITVLVVAHTWAVEAVPDPPITITFITAPPPPLGDGGGRTTTGAPPAPRRRPVLAQPLVIPGEPAKAASPTAADEPRTDLVPGSVGEGSDIGIPGGVGQTEPSWSPPPEYVEQVLRLAPEMTPPRAIVLTQPIYPEVARKARRQGTVIVEAVIDRAGYVVDARILREVGLGCGDAAVNAIRTWRYAPALLNGRPVSVYLTVTVSFQLN
jgi:protein TonB